MRASNIVDREYMLGELIGARGLARVYTAEDASKSRVAVKVDLVVDNGAAFLVMEHVLGVPFGALIRHVGPVPL